MTNQEIYDTLKNQGFGVKLHKHVVEAYLDARKLYRQEIEVALPEVPDEMIIQSGDSVTIFGIDS